MATTTSKKKTQRRHNSAVEEFHLQVLHDDFAKTKTDTQDRLDNIEELSEENRGDITHQLWRIERLEKFVGFRAEEEGAPAINVIKEPCLCGNNGTAPGEIFMWGMMTGICLVTAILIHQASRSRRFYYGQ